MKIFLVLMFVFFSSLSYSQKYWITEDVTVKDGQSYNINTKAGQYIRNLKTISGNDSVVITNLAVLVNTAVFSYGTLPSTLKTADKQLYTLYLNYCNKIVLDTILISGYKNALIQTADGTLTQKMVFNSNINYNQYRFKKYKNVPSTETRTAVLSTGMTICWTKISYYVLQRKSSISDFYNWYCKKLSYNVTEDITISNGEKYNNWSTTGKFIRNLRSSAGNDSIVTTNLIVNQVNITYTYGVAPTTIINGDKELYRLYLLYCNTIVSDTVKINGYKSLPVQNSDFNLSQKIVVNSKINYNQYRFKKYKNIPSTETRLATLTSDKTIYWTTVTYSLLQRLSNITDFNKYYTTLPIFGTPPTTIKPSDFLLYNKYLIYCNKMVLDTVKIVGYKSPLIFNVNKYTQNIVVNSTINYNQYRKKKYKNIPSTETRLPAIIQGKEYYWCEITYWVLQRKPTYTDFYNWYYNKKL